MSIKMQVINSIHNGKLLIRGRLGKTHHFCTFCKAVKVVYSGVPKRYNIWWRPMKCCYRCILLIMKFYPKNFILYSLRTWLAQALWYFAHRSRFCDCELMCARAFICELEGTLEHGYASISVLCFTWKCGLDRLHTNYHLSETMWC